MVSYTPGTLDTAWAMPSGLAIPKQVMLPRQDRLSEFLYEARFVCSPARQEWRLGESVRGHGTVSDLHLRCRRRVEEGAFVVVISLGSAWRLRWDLWRMRRTRKRDATRPGGVEIIKTCWEGRLV